MAEPLDQVTLDLPPMLSGALADLARRHGSSFEWACLVALCAGTGEALKEEADLASDDFCRELGEAEERPDDPDLQAIPDEMERVWTEALGGQEPEGAA